MDYRVQAGDTTLGPFTLAQLNAEVQSGRISASALVQSQGMTEWFPASQVLGNIPVPPVATPIPTTAPADEASLDTVGLPPNLHWGILLLLVIFTEQLFNCIWALVLGNWARKVDRDNKPLVLVAMYPAGIIGGVVATASDNPAIGGLLILGGLIAYIIGVFTIKASIETYYERAGLSDTGPNMWSRIPSSTSGAQKLSGVGVLFLSTVYLQYHINKIAKLKKSGQLRDTRVTS